MMDRKDKAALIIAAVLERQNKFRLPRFVSLKKKVDNGEATDDLSCVEISLVWKQ